jgi:hypothetical protein
MLPVYDRLSAKAFALADPGTERFKRSRRVSKHAPNGRRRAAPPGQRGCPVRVLVDTSVWAGHFKQRDETLLTLLERHAICGRGCGLVDFSRMALAPSGQNTSP